MTNSNPNIVDLRWLLLGLALVMGLHFHHFAAWVSISVIALAIWRYLTEHFQWKMPKIIVLMPLTILAGLGIMLEYRGLFGRDASVELLALMLMLKLMETKTRRDFTILIYGGYFLTITTFLFTQSMVYGIAMLFSTLVLTATLVGISHPNGNLNWRFQAKFAGVLMAQAAPIMLALFLLFPRIPGPLWSMPQDANQGMSGLSDNMEPGNISELTLSGEIAFRVDFDGAAPPYHKLYWRGPVLWHFDGRNWSMPSIKLDLPTESISTSGTPTNYTITMEPSNRQHLLLLDVPTQLPLGASLSRDYQALNKDPIRTRTRYQATSHLDYTLGADVSGRILELNLQIPDFDNPKTRALAQQWVDEGKSPQEIVQAALRMFQFEEFIYTLRPARLGREPIDDFLFNTREGFCEHFSSSFVYLMRAAGVPARVVTGYQGGELNPFGNYYIVRQSDAHAWAEVWYEDKGWVRVDPTGAVSATRIEQGIESALPFENPIPLFARSNSPRIKQIYLNFDAIDKAWNDWVLDYDQKRQLDLLSKLSGSKLSTEDIIIVMIIGVGLVALILAYFIVREHSGHQDPAQRLYMKFVRKMQRAGVTRAPHEGPLDFSQRAIARMPNKASDIKLITKIYTELRYRSRESMESFQLLKELVGKFK